MRIVMITNHSYMFYQFRKELVKELLHEHEVILLTPYVGRIDELEALGCKCIEVDVDRRSMNVLKDIQLFFTYYQLLKQLKPDKVITYSIKPNIYASYATKLLNIDTYVNVQGLGSAFQNKYVAILVSFLYKLALRDSKVVFFENKGNMNEFINRKIFKEYKGKCLHGAGVNLETYSYEEYKEDEKIHFLFVGRIMKEKGVEELFDAITKLKEKYNVVLDIIGFYEESYKERIQILEDKQIVKYHGFKEDPRPYYKLANCVVLPSYHEGMSNVLLEASATGRAIITTNIHGCKEAVEIRQNGYLCNVKDSQSLYEKMEAFMNLTFDQRKEMGIKGREFMTREFSKEKVVQDTLESIFKK